MSENWSAQVILPSSGMDIPRSRSLHTFTAPLKTWYSLSNTVFSPNPCSESAILSLAEAVWPLSWVSRRLGVDCVDGWSQARVGSGVSSLAGVEGCGCIAIEVDGWGWDVTGVECLSGRGRAGPSIGCCCAAGPWKVLNGTDCGITGAGKAGFRENTCCIIRHIEHICYACAIMTTSDAFGPGAPAAAVAVKNCHPIIPDGSYHSNCGVCSQYKFRMPFWSWHWFSMTCVEVDPGPVLVEGSTPPCWGV